MKKLTINYATAWLMGIDPDATGQQLRSMRRAHHLTQESLSELFENGGDPVSKNAISTWETGKKLPSLPHVVFLAELYGCTLDELVLSYRRSRDEDDRDQPVPFYSNNVIWRRMYAKFICSVFFFVTQRFHDCWVFIFYNGCIIQIWRTTT
ncbi:helix-turn-helix transcriptional regulator [Lachnospiraceae bacterium MD308]|nr:helix-turn-helix transcriptional regulator [Lachnospiraceae bacterium MD308]